MTQNFERLSANLITWFKQFGRKLPWRENRTPYHVWISEIMLQQTRVDTVVPYYQKWLKAFPTVQRLAEADELDVLCLWEGLGYYSRARSIHQTAQILVQAYRGELPADPAALRSLPGIGPYTAGSISSIAFGIPFIAMDGNVRRVYSRLRNVEAPLKSKKSESELRAIADVFLQTPTVQNNPGDFLEGLMDLGATVCVPSAPSCDECPWKEECAAKVLGLENERPITEKKAPVPSLVVTAAVIPNGKGDVLMTRRPKNGLLGGLWEFPGGKVEEGETLEDCVRREIQEELGLSFNPTRPFGVYRHAYTHFKITLHAFVGKIPADAKPRNLVADDMAWIKPEDLTTIPMGKVDRQIANHYLFEINTRREQP